MHDVAQDPEHELRREFDKSTRRFIDALRTSPEYQARGAALKREFLAYLQEQNYYRDAWSSLKNHVARDLEGENSMFVANGAGAVGAIAGALRDDEALQRKLHGWLLRGVERLMLDHRHQISRLITDVVRIGTHAKSRRRSNSRSARTCSSSRSTARSSAASWASSCAQ